MKYKPGDEVLIKAEIANTCPSSERPYFVAPDKYSVNWVSEEKVFPADKTYEQGLSDAWELARRLYALRPDEREEMFKYCTVKAIIEDCTIEEVMDKIEAYEFMKRIQEGDVVEASNGLKGVVVKILPSGGLNIIHGNGLFSADCPDVKYKKTGKHIDIESLLQQIGE